MFGLLKHRKSCQEGYNSFRQNYCGVCKTIGTLYGQKERYFLNNDIVFLSELLSVISNCETDFKYIKVNSCFNLPNENEQIPSFLKYVASINIILGYFKILDNIEDSKYKINPWRILKFIETPKYKKSKRFLESVEFKTLFIENSINQQINREKDKKRFDSLQDSLKYYSEITGKITGEVFKQGSIIIEKKNLSNLLYIIGQKFGEIVYLIDAINDFKKDIKYNSFNLFYLSESWGKGQITSTDNQVTNDYIYSNLSIIQNSISLLPISENVKKTFNLQLVYSINQAINKEKTQIHCNFGKYLTLKDRFSFAIKTSSIIISQKKHNVIFRSTFFIVIATYLIILFLLYPNLIQANSLSGIEGNDWCANCCDGCCSGSCNCCSNCCGCGNCYGNDETICCHGVCNGCQTACCNWPGCLFTPCLCCIPSCICGACGGGGGPKPTIIFIPPQETCCCKS